MPRDVRGTRAYRGLRDHVIQQEPTCWLQYPGICLGQSTTADHVIPYEERPDLALVRTNLRGACEPCNRKRGASGAMPVIKTTTISL